MTIKAHPERIGMILGCVLLTAAFAEAQLPGDGIPDIYYFDFVGASVITTVGPVSRPQGTLLVDTDGTNMVALQIGGPNPFPTTPDNGNYLIGNTARLPDPNAPAPLFASDWSVDFIAGSAQWIRTNPLETDGFVGVIGEYDDPFGIFPELAIANYVPNPDFDAVFDDGTGAMWEVQYTTHASGTIWTNVTCPFFCVPEPKTSSLLGFAALGMLTLRRR